MKIVECPQCGAPVKWQAESKWRPFCSERCRLIDLGAWASEEYAIPAEDSPLSEELRQDRDFVLGE